MHHVVVPNERNKHWTQFPWIIVKWILIRILVLILFVSRKLLFPKSSVDSDFSLIICQIHCVYHSLPSKQRSPTTSTHYFLKSSQCSCNHFDQFFMIKSIDAIWLIAIGLDWSETCCGASNVKQDLLCVASTTISNTLDCHSIRTFGFNSWISLWIGKIEFPQISFESSKRFKFDFFSSFFIEFSVELPKPMMHSC